GLSAGGLAAVGRGWSGVQRWGMETSHQPKEYSLANQWLRLRRFCLRHGGVAERGLPVHLCGDPHAAFEAAHG
ncbi:unnamed protein product, partial [Heterosigma akashiwo]